MKFRHECKYEINALDRLTLRARLKAVCRHDEHAVNGTYDIRSIYFDTPSDKALMEKLNGVNVRDKYRIRFYNFDTSTIFLEKKSKINGLCAKESCRITKEEAANIAKGTIEWMQNDERSLLGELYYHMVTERLAPKTIVDYTREPFVYKSGNVRVTIDYNIRTGDFRTDFLNPDTILLPAGDKTVLLEIKWDEYLPLIIKDACFIPGRRITSFSKYAQCRIYG